MSNKSKKLDDSHKEHTAILKKGGKDAAKKLDTLHEKRRGILEGKNNG